MLQTAILNSNVAPNTRVCQILCMTCCHFLTLVDHVTFAGTVEIIIILLPLPRQTGRKQATCIGDFLRLYSSLYIYGGP